MIGQILYLVSEAFRGWKQHHTVILPSLVTIFLCSFLLSVSVTLLVGAKRVLSQRESLYHVEVFFKTEPTPQIQDSLTRSIMSIKAVKSVQYRSSEQALDEFRKHFSARMLDLVDGNPLPASFRVELLTEFHNPAILNRVVWDLSRWSEFEEVQAPIKWVEWMERWRFDFVFWPLGISALLLLTLALIIGNAVRLTLFSRKLLVENMKYAGGSPFFIQFPFVLEGFMQGLLGSGTAVVFWWILLRSLLKNFPGLAPHLTGFSWSLPLIVLVVTSVGAYSSFRAVRSFLFRQA